MALSEQEWQELSIRDPYEYIRLAEQNRPADYYGGLREPEPQPAVPYYQNTSAPQLPDYVGPDVSHPQVQYAYQAPEVQAQRYAQQMQSLKLLQGLMNLQQEREQMNAMQRKRQADAIRFQGMQEYSNLINAGKPHSEAYKQTFKKLYYDNPMELIDAQAKMEALESRRNFKPTLEKFGEFNLMRMSPDGGYQNLGRDSEDKPFKPDPAQTKIAGKEFDLAKTYVEKNPDDFAGRARLGLASDALRDSYREPIENDPTANARTGELRLAERELTRPAAVAAKQLTKDVALQFLKQAKGDKGLARKLAKEAGYAL